jgi:hypothetical protein
MGGSGGRSDSREDQDIAAVRREIHDQLRQQELDAEMNGFLAEQLAGYNDRDTRLTQDRLDAVEEALGTEAVAVDRLLFGGSVAKHTYVDGLSDVDALVVVNDPDASPGDLVSRFADALRGWLGSGDILEVASGKLAVTVTYRDGAQVQLLPAVERDGRTSIPSEDGRSWRHIRPHKFAQKLTQVNQANGGTVVPAIKLAKAAIAKLPEGQQMSGYHIEAIAVDAFKEYSGRRDRVSMLKHLIEHVAEAVLQPTGDITGQSVHIDEHLGATNSSQRQAISASIRRLAVALENATSASDYRNLFYE